jgi:hypothetical protein
MPFRTKNSSFRPEMQTLSMPYSTIASVSSFSFSIQAIPLESSLKTVIIVSFRNVLHFAQSAASSMPCHALTPLSLWEMNGLSQ